LDSLEKEYKREEDFCHGDPKGGQSVGSVRNGSDSSSDKEAQIAQFINKHQEQKEAFLKACTHARHTARNFLKICHRVAYPYQYESSGIKSPEMNVKG